MSEPSDNKPADPAFEEYLGRKSEVSRRYRAIASDEVPPELDRIVLAQARDAVATGKVRQFKRPVWVRWAAPVALAACAVFAVSIVMRSGSQHQVTSRDAAPLEYKLPEAPAPVELAKEKAEAPLMISPAFESAAQDASPSRPSPEPAAEQSARQDHKRTVGPVAAPMAVSSPPPAVRNEQSVERKAQAAPAPLAPAMNIADRAIAGSAAQQPVAADERQRTEDDLSEVRVTGTLRKMAPAGQGAGPRGSVPAAATQSASAEEESTGTAQHESNPRDWLEHIRTLRRAGDVQQADREWGRFQRAYPEFVVTPDDVARPARR